MIGQSTPAGSVPRIATLIAALVFAACSAPASTNTPSADPTTRAAVATPTVGPTPTIGPRDAYIAFQGFGSTGSYGVQLIRPDGTDQRSPMAGVSRGDQEHPDWSHDGTRLTFSVKVGDREELWVADIDGSNARKVVACDGDCLWADEPAWSPDDQSIAFHRMMVVAGSARSSLEILDVRSMAIDVVMVAPARHVILAPRWSPDGNRLAVEYLELADETVDGAFIGDTISIVDLTAKPRSLQDLLPNSRLANNPDWSPGGDLIVFSAPAEGGEPGGDRSDLWTMRPDGTELRQVTRVAASGGYAVQPTFTPDGSRIVFVLGAQSGGPGRMAWIALDGSAPQAATTSGYIDGVHPRLRPVP